MMSPEQKRINLFNHVNLLCMKLNENGFQRRVNGLAINQPGVTFESWEVKLPENPFLTFSDITGNRTTFFHLKNNGYLDIGVCWLCGNEPIDNNHLFRWNADRNMKFFICKECYVRKYDKSIMLSAAFVVLSSGIFYLTVSLFNWSFNIFLWGWFSQIILVGWILLIPRYFYKYRGVAL